MECESEHGGGGGEEDVGRDTELVGDVNNSGGEEIDDQSGDGDGGLGEGGLDVGLVALDVEGDEILNAVGVGGGIDGLEVLESDIEAGGSDGLDVGGEGGGRCLVGGLHEEDGDGEELLLVLELEEAFCRLKHGHQVASAPCRHENQAKLSHPLRFRQFAGEWMASLSKGLGCPTAHGWDFHPGFIPIPTTQIRTISLWTSPHVPSVGEANKKILLADIGRDHPKRNDDVDNTDFLCCSKGSRLLMICS